MQNWFVAQKAERERGLFQRPLVTLAFKETVWAGHFLLVLRLYSRLYKCAIEYLCQTGPIVVLLVFQIKTRQNLNHCLNRFFNHWRGFRQLDKCDKKIFCENDDVKWDLVLSPVGKESSRESLDYTFKTRKMKWPIYMLYRHTCWQKTYTHNKLFIIAEKPRASN